MQLRNHIVYPFLMSPVFIQGLIKAVYPTEYHNLKTLGIGQLDENSIVSIGTFGGIIMPAES